eukprot:TRINITY_DN8713_c0_g1_i1.p1 TRINITY_DN8713_c0_g1~~TRINITY_DN8713_c0_g1_i1.p1  ORF type:complete len:376 (+),score=30.87 TRINITY_DN8713_c0_g1_i1:32-1129(+)
MRQSLNNLSGKTFPFGSLSLLLHVLDRLSSATAFSLSSSSQSACSVDAEDASLLVLSQPKTPNNATSSVAAKYPKAQDCCSFWEQVAVAEGRPLSIPASTKTSPLGIYRISDIDRTSSLYIKDHHVVFDSIDKHYWRSSKREAVACAVNDGEWTPMPSQHFSCNPQGVGRHECGYVNGWILWHDGATYSALDDGHPCTVPGYTTSGPPAGLIYIDRCVPSAPAHPAKTCCSQWEQVAVAGGNPKSLPANTKTSPLGIYRISDIDRTSSLYIKDHHVVFDSSARHYWRSSKREAVQCAVNDGEWTPMPRQKFSCDPQGVGFHECGWGNGWILWHEGSTWTGASNAYHPCKIAARWDLLYVDRCVST